MEYKFKDEFINFEGLQNVLDKTNVYVVKSIIVAYVGEYPLCCIDGCYTNKRWLSIACAMHQKVMCAETACINIVPNHILKAGHRVCFTHLKIWNAICDINGCGNLKYIKYNGYERICSSYCHECLHNEFY